MSTKFLMPSEKLQRNQILFLPDSKTKMYMRFVKQGYLERVKNGYYKLPVGDEPKEELILSKLMTHG